MAKKKRPAASTVEGDPEAALKRASGGAVGTSLKDLLADVAVPEKAAVRKVEPVKEAPAPRRSAQPVIDPGPSARPSETLRGDDRIAYLGALAGAKPLAGRAAIRIGRVVDKKITPRREDGEHDAMARAKLAALVAGGVRIDVHRDGDWIEGMRPDVKPAVLDALARATVGKDATLDLHGFRADRAREEVARFVRRAQRAGIRRVLIIHGKGTHSADGHGVLRDIVVEALSEGGAAPSTLAFVTAPASLGGTGALLVELMR